MEQMKLANGLFAPFPVRKITMDMPPASITSFGQFLAGQNMQQHGMTDYAAMNRPDSEKTKGEIVMAKQAGDELAESTVAPWALFIHTVFTMAWEVIKSQALLGNVIIQETHETLLKPVIIAPYGEYESIYRARYRNRLMTFHPLIKGTPVELPFMKTMIREFFPQQAAMWQKEADILGQMQQQIQSSQAQIAQLSAMLMEVTKRVTQHAKLSPDLTILAAQLGAATSGMAQPSGDATTPPSA
jgi:hypothetical protein